MRPRPETAKQYCVCSSTLAAKVCRCWVLARGPASEAGEVEPLLREVERFAEPIDLRYDEPLIALVRTTLSSRRDRAPADGLGTAGT